MDQVVAVALQIVYGISNLALISLGLAIMTPLEGRLIDRRGAKEILVPGIIAAAAVISLLSILLMSS